MSKKSSKTQVDKLITRVEARVEDTAKKVVRLYALSILKELETAYVKSINYFYDSYDPVKYNRNEYLKKYQSVYIPTRRKHTITVGLYYGDWAYDGLEPYNDSVDYVWTQTWVKGLHGKYFKGHPATTLMEPPQQFFANEVQNIVRKYGEKYTPAKSRGFTMMFN